jgi:hypothetical protein
MKKIQPTEFYTSSEIVARRITRGSNEDTRRQLLLRDIRNGELKAKNVGTKLKPRYVVLGKDLLAFTRKK